MEDKDKLVTLEDLGVAYSDVKADLTNKADIIINSASGAIASFNDGANYPVKQTVFEMNPVQNLNGQEYPYPAGGGANKWNEEWEQGYYNVNTGEATPSTTQIRSKNRIGVTPSTAYYIKTSSSLWVLEYDENDTYLNVYTAKANAALTVSANTHYIRFYTVNAYGNTYKNDIAINYPSTVTTYSPYKNICPIIGRDSVTVYVSPESSVVDGTEEHDIDFGQTVYAGQLTINEDGSGQIVSTMTSVDLGSYNWSLGGTSASPVFYTTIPGKKTGYDSKNVCSAYSYYGAYFTGMSNNQFASNSSFSYLYVKDLRFDNTADFKAGVTGVQLVYELATPVTINLTEQEVIETLYGNNNLWHDANGDTEVTYRADTKLYIDNKFAELQTLIANL